MDNRCSIHGSCIRHGVWGEERVVDLLGCWRMILKTVCALLSLVLEIFGVYGDGEFKWYYGYPYIAVVLNLSQLWALYCLVQFYNLTHHRLQHIKPLAKFISFKAIVFATWWQGVGIVLICYFGVLPKEKKIQNGLAAVAQLAT